MTLEKCITIHTAFIAVYTALHFSKKSIDKYLQHKI